MTERAEKQNVVRTIVARHLCCGCGMCAQVCPTEALAMQETPAGFLQAQEADAAACVECGLCARVCPADALHESEEMPPAGAALEAHWGYAENDQDRLLGVSGGVVTALLAELLRRDAITGAVVVRWRSEDALRPEAIVARTVEELRSARKSKYCMVSLASALDELESREDERLAVVGLPCHLQAVENAVEAGAIPQKSIRLRVGLFCDRVLSYHAIDDLIAEAGVTRDEVAVFNYRDKRPEGWPGEVGVETTSGEVIFRPRQSRMHLKNAHTPVRCMVCAAKFNPSADIAVGDAYGYEGEDASQGLSALLVRTETGREMLHEAADALNLTATSPERLLEGHEQVDCEVSVRAFEALVGFPSAPRAPAGEAPAAAVADIRWRMRVESAESEAEAVRMTRRKLRAEWLRRMLRMPLGLAKRIMRILARGGRA